MRGPIISSMASTSIWNVSGVTSTNAGTRPARIIGAMSVENVTADVMISSPGSSPEHLDGEVQRGAAGVAHDTPRRLPNSSATRRSMARDVLADAQRRRPTAQHLDDGLDLTLVVDRAGVVDMPRALGTPAVTPIDASSLVSVVMGLSVASRRFTNRI